MCFKGFKGVYWGFMGVPCGFTRFKRPPEVFHRTSGNFRGAARGFKGL